MRLKKTSILISVVIILITTFFVLVPKVKLENDNKEKRGIFISYIEYTKYFSNKNSSEIKKEINNIINTVKEYNLNMIILQVRPFSDSIYKSSIYPSSKTITNNEGEQLPFDILEYFINKSHEKDIEIHAWINPYRIRTNTDISSISIKNPAYKWLNTNNVKIIENKGIYYNPASIEVQDLIVEGILEIIKNYNVDGIHMDDYFYPDDTIDLENYNEVKNQISLTDYRLSNTNQLIKRIYQTIKKINKDIEFGISPEGNIENNYNKNYADIKTWVQNDGYLDYIMPQIYYGFFNETKPFIETLNEWKNLITIDIDFIPALALYKAGQIDEYAMGGRNEWINFNDVIAKQIKVIRSNDEIDGISLFRYDYLIEKSNNNLIKEQKVIKETLKSKKV